MVSESKKSKPPNVAGIFFADDHVIWATTYANPFGPTYPAMTFDLKPDLLAINPDTKFYYRAQNFEAKATAEEDILAAVIAIKKHVGKDNIEHLQSITVASVGPFRDPKLDAGERLSGESDRTIRNEFEGSDRISNVCRSDKWRNIKIKHLVSKAFDHPININCITDAEAMVLGEHYFYRQKLINDFKRTTPNDHEGFKALKEHLGKDTVAYLLLDEGIGGAVFKNNSFVRGEMPLELGHLPVYPFPNFQDEYPIDSCGLHFSACLEGTISLPVMRRHWNISVSELEDLPPNAIELNVLGWYIAQAVQHLVMAHSPTVILLGGKLMYNKHLLKHVRKAYDFIAQPLKQDAKFPHYQRQDVEKEFIKRWTQPDAGVLGCLAWSFRRMERGDNVIEAESRFR